MSKQIQQFHELILQDPALKEKLKAATDQASLARLAVEVGTELGYSFTHKEAERYINQNIFTLMRQFS